jgi:hypothetical protein
MTRVFVPGGYRPPAQVYRTRFGDHIIAYVEFGHVELVTDSDASPQDLAAVLEHAAAELRAGAVGLDVPAAGVPSAVAVATEYSVSCLPLDHPDHTVLSLTVAHRGPGDVWAVTDRFGSCLAADGEWDYEPRPSERHAAWKASHRFPLVEALARAEALAPQLSVNGRTVADVLAKEATR